jgi:DNA-directed RNA polymerase specialized sigma24 family protein
MEDHIDDGAVPPGGLSDDLTTGADSLAGAYRRALELDTAGASPPQIAAELDVPVEAVPSLLRLARAKADAARRAPLDE